VQARREPAANRVDPLELRQIRYALSVAKERSFTRAASRLNVSQSAVSAQIKMLEDEIGFPLFRRGTRGVEVTEPGRTFLQEAERITGDLLNLTATARRLRGGLETLNLGMVSGAAPIFVPRLFGDLSQTIRDVQLRLVVEPTRGILNDLQEQRLDAGIAIEPEPGRLPVGLELDRLATVDMALIVHPRHRLAERKEPIDIATLAAEPVVMNELEVGYGQIVLSLFADIGMRPKILAVADNIETIKVIVRSGAGVAIIPRACAEQEMSGGFLKAKRLAPERNVAFSLFRRREPLSGQKEMSLHNLVRALKT
jgi:DNA-binding transcriptional LysR family regulator